MTLTHNSDSIVPNQGHLFSGSDSYLNNPLTTPEVNPPGFLREHRTVTLWCCNCGEPKIVKLKCGSRSCPECRGKDYARLLRSYSKPLEQYRQDRGLATSEFKLLTLTMKNVIPSDMDYMTVRRVRQVVRDMYKAFSRMRRWKKYNSVLRGGLRVVELKYSPATGWNVHAHILYEGAYYRVCCQTMKKLGRQIKEWKGGAENEDDMRKVARRSNRAVSKMESEMCRNCRDKCLRYDWKRVSGSPVVDVKRAYNPVAGLRYILKYLSKPPEVNGREETFDLIMKGFRAVQPFGCWYDIKPAKPKMMCPFCGASYWMSSFQLQRMLDNSCKVLRFPSERERPSPATVTQLDIDFENHRLEKVAG